MNAETKIVVFSGLPCSGKSTISEAIAKKLAWPVFSVDPIESAILRSGLQRSFATGLAAYLVTEALATEQLKLSISVIIDAVNPVQESRQIWSQLAHKYQAKLFIIECVLPPETHKKRIENRIRNLHGIPEITWEELNQRKKEFLPWSEERLTLNTESNRDEIIAMVLNYIDELK